MMVLRQSNSSAIEFISASLQNSEKHFASPYFRIAISEMLSMIFSAASLRLLTTMKLENTNSGGISEQHSN